MATGTGTFTYDVTAAPGAGASGSGTFSYDVTAPGSGASGSGTFSYDVTTPVGPAGLWLRTGLTTAVRPRLFRRTGAATAVELVPTVSGGGGGGGGGGTPPALSFIYPGDQAGATPSSSLNYAPPAGAIYVDPVSGTSGGAGTLASPVQTVAQANTKVAAGGTIVIGTAAQEYILHEGVAMPIDGAGYTAALTYAGVSITKANVTIQPYPGASIVMDGTSVQTGWTQAGGVWSKALQITHDRGATDTYGKLDNDARGIGWLWTRSQNWHDLVVAAGSTEQQAEMFPLASWPEQVWIAGVRQKQVATLAEVVPGTFFVEGAAAGTNGILWTSSRYHLGTDPTGKEVRVSDLCTSLSSSSGATGVTFKGLKFRRFAGSVQMGGVVKCRAAGTTFEDCIVEDCMIGFDSITDNSKFIRCEGWRCGVLSFKGASVYGLTYDRCLSKFANFARFNWAPVSGGVKLTACRNVLVTGCDLSDGWTKGFWTDVSCYLVDIVNTRMANNEQFGLVAEISAKHRLINCTILNTGKDGFLWHDSNDTEMWHCAVKGSGRLKGQIYDSNNPRGIKVYQDNRRVQDSPADGGVYPNYGRDNRQTLATNTTEQNNFLIEKMTIYNNVFDQGTSLQFAYFPIEDLQKAQSNSRDISAYGLLSGGNILSRVSTTNPTWGWLAPGVGNTQTIVTSLSQWRTVSGQDASSVEVLGTSPTNVNGILISRDQWAAGGSKAVTTQALPADIAALIGVAPGNYPPGIIPIPVGG